MSDLTVGQAAEVLGVSTRTLRHWDSIGLLRPSFRSWSDYRLYTEEDWDTALAILVYRETGMPLKDIAAIIHDGASTVKSAAVTATTPARPHRSPAPHGRRSHHDPRKGPYYDREN